MDGWLHGWSTVYAGMFDGGHGLGTRSIVATNILCYSVYVWLAVVLEISAAIMMSLLI